MDHFRIALMDTIGFDPSKQVTDKEEITVDEKATIISSNTCDRVSIVCLLMNASHELGSSKSLTNHVAKKGCFSYLPRLHCKLNDTSRSSGNL